MKIAINIPRKTYEHIRSHGGHGIFNIQGDDNLIVTKAIFNGIVEERPQGKWIQIFENPFTNGYVCPFCGHRIQVTEQFLPEVTKCEGCGADMMGDKNYEVN